MRQTKTIVRFARTNREPESNLPKVRVSRRLSVQELLSSANLNLNEYLKLSTGEMSPFYEKDHAGNFAGEPRAAVIRIMKVLKCEFGDLFPRYVCKLPCEYLSLEQVESLCVSEYSRGKKSRDLESLFSQLNDRERIVIEDRIFEDKTLQEVADKFGVSRERIRQIEGKARRKLRKTLRAEQQ